MPFFLAVAFSHCLQETLKFIGLLSLKPKHDLMGLKTVVGVHLLNEDLYHLINTAVVWGWDVLCFEDAVPQLNIVVGVNPLMGCLHNSMRIT